MFKNQWKKLIGEEGEVGNQKQKKKMENIVFLVVIIIITIVAINFIWNDKKETKSTPSNTAGKQLASRKSEVGSQISRTKSVKALLIQETTILPCNKKTIMYQSNKTSKTS